MSLLNFRSLSIKFDLNSLVTDKLKDSFEGIVATQSLMLAKKYLSVLCPEASNFIISQYSNQLKPGFTDPHHCTLSHVVETVKDVFDTPQISYLNSLDILIIAIDPSRTFDSLSPTQTYNISLVFDSLLHSFDNDVHQYLNDMILCLSDLPSHRKFGIDLFFAFRDQIAIEQDNVAALRDSPWSKTCDYLGCGELSILINAFSILYNCEFRYASPLDGPLPINHFIDSLNILYRYQNCVVFDPEFDDFNFSIVDSVSIYQTVTYSGIPLYLKPKSNTNHYFTTGNHGLPKFEVTLTDLAKRLSSISSCVVAVLNLEDIFIFNNLLTYYSFFRPRANASEQMYSHVKTISYDDHSIEIKFKTLLTTINLTFPKHAMTVFLNSPFDRSAFSIDYSYTYSNGYIFEVLHRGDSISRPVRYPVFPLYFPSVKEEYIPNKYIGVFSTISTLNSCALEVAYALARVEYCNEGRLNKLLLRHTLAHLINSKYHGTGHALIPQPLLFMAAQNHASSRVFNATGSKFFLHDSLLSQDGKVQHVCRLCGNIGTSQYITRICEFFGQVQKSVMLELELHANPHRCRSTDPDIFFSHLNHSFISTFLDPKSYKGRGPLRQLRVPFSFERFNFHFSEDCSYHNYYFDTVVVPSSLHPTVEPLFDSFNLTQSELDDRESDSLARYRSSGDDDFYPMDSCDDNFFSRAIQSNMNAKEGYMCRVADFWRDDEKLFAHAIEKTVYLDAVEKSDFIDPYPLFPPVDLLNIFRFGPPDDNLGPHIE